MPNIKTKFTKIATKLLSMIGLVAMVAGLALTSAIPTNAAYNAGANRYDDTLNNPHQEATYIYNYENTAPDAAPGYFEIPLSSITGAATDSLLEVTSITDTFPVDATTYVPVTGAQTITTNPASATYVTAGTKYIRISPQIACVASATGCTSGNIPAAVPGKITIKLAIRTSAPVTPSIVDGQGKIYFPNGFDMNAIGWRLNVNYVKTNDVLDPSVMPTATITGQGGTGTPTIGQPYSVSTTGIRAVDGNPLNAPNGTCRTVISGTTYTGTGITNGVCLVNVPVNATATAIPAGTVDLSDGGVTRPIVLNGIPYASVTPGQGSSPLVTADIPGLTVTCSPAAINSTTTCTFTLPANKTLPATFKLGVNDATPAGTCTASGSAVTCTNVPTGTQTGLQPVFGQIGTDAKTDTGEDVQINPAATNTTPITQADLTNLGFNCGINNTVPVNSTATCTGTLPTGKALDPSNPLKLTIGNATGTSDTCTSSGSTIVCANVPTGSTTGSQPLKAQLGSGAMTNTGTNVNVDAGVTPLTQADIPNLNAIATITCVPDPVAVGGTTACSGTLPANKSAPVDGLKLNVEGQTPVTCTFSGQVFTCAGMPAGNTPGNRNIQGSVGNGTPQNTGKTINIGNRLITDADLPFIGTGSDRDPFSSLICGASNVVTAGRPTTCFGTLKDGWSIPEAFRLGIGYNPGGTCTQSRQSVVCTAVPVTDTPGNAVPVKAQIGSGSIVDTGKKVAVQIIAASLARTGGAALIGLGVALLAGLAGFVAYTRYSKISAKNVKLD
jgi:hypothetical protein